MREPATTTPVASPATALPDASSAVTAGAVAAAERGTRRWSGFGLAFWLSAAWLATLLLCALTASWLPLHPNAFDPAHALAAPSWAHPFGTTRLGEDVLAICVHGTRLSIVVALGAMTIAVAIGAPIGMAAGYFRGRVDRVATTLIDASMAVPTLVLALSLVLVLGQSMSTIVLVIGGLSAPSFARVARSATLTVADRDYVQAARLSGARHRRILLREVRPNIAVPLAAFALLLAGYAILIEGGLSFIGIGAPLDKASWGRLVFSGRDDLQRAWWWSLCPSGVFFLTVLALNVAGDALQARWLGMSRHRRARRATARSGARSGVTLPSPVPLVRAARPHDGRPASAVDWGLPSTTEVERDVVLDVVGLHTTVTTAYGRATVVAGVDLRLARGELVAIVGESGAGKTMLARSILGIEPDGAHVEGQVLLDAMDLRTLDRSALRQCRGRDIAIVLQDPMTALNPLMRVGNQIAELLRAHLDVSRSFARKLAVQALGEVGIAEPEKRVRQYPHELSGGQRQRVAIALALACGPKVLIADEPTSALDAVVQAQILDLIDRLRHERRLAVLLITHDLAVALHRADRVAVMYAGRIVEQATRGYVADGLRMPYASALFAAAPRLSAPAHTPLVSIPGRAPAPGPDGDHCAFAPRCARADALCNGGRPVLQPIGIEHDVACWHPLASPAAKTQDIDVSFVAASGLGENAGGRRSGEHP